MAVYRPDPELLTRQIRSLQAQTVTDWVCRVGIDGRDAESRALLERLCAEDGRFEILEFDRNVGVYRHFERLLENLPDDIAWVSLADQDDHWYPDKFAKLLPTLEHPDISAVTGQAQVVDRFGTVWSTTERIPGDVVGTLLRNQLTGSLAIVTRRVVDDALPFPVGTDIAIHDHWLAVCAAASGRIAVVDEVVQDYVQHESNVLGEARPSSPWETLRNVRLIGLRRFLDDVSTNHWGWRVSMAAALCERNNVSEPGLMLKGIARGYGSPAAVLALLSAVRAGQLPWRAAAGFAVASLLMPRHRAAGPQDDNLGPSAPTGQMREAITVLKRAVTRVRTEVERKLRQTKDPNFIGFDKYARHGAYHWRELTHNGDYLSKADFVRARVGKEDRLIDLGCGDGAYIFSLAGDVASIKGIDADFDAARLANEQLVKNSVSNGDVEQLPLSRIGSTPGTAGPFDLAYSMDVIEHLPQPEELLEAAARVVKPDGLVIVGTPLFIRDELVSPYHVKEFSQQEIHDIMVSRLEVLEEHLLPEMRSDGQTYHAFYIGVGRPKAQ